MMYLFCFELCVYTCAWVWVSVHESRYPGRAEEGVGSLAALLTGIVNFLTWVRGWGTGVGRQHVDACKSRISTYLISLSLSLSFSLSLSCVIMPYEEKTGLPNECFVCLVLREGLTM